MIRLLPLLLALALAGCRSDPAASPDTAPKPADPTAAAAASGAAHPAYFDRTGRADVLTGGERMIPITTPATSNTTARIVPRLMLNPSLDGKKYRHSGRPVAGADYLVRINLSLRVWRNR